MLISKATNKSCTFYLLKYSLYIYDLGIMGIFFMVLSFMRTSGTMIKKILETISILSIDILSDNGPNTTIESGIIPELIIFTIENTLPYIASSTVSCNITIAGVLKNGIVIPNSPITIK